MPPHVAEARHRAYALPEDENPTLRLPGSRVALHGRWRWLWCCHTNEAARQPSRSSLAHTSLNIWYRACTRRWDVNIIFWHFLAFFYTSFRDFLGIMFWKLRKKSAKTARWRSKSAWKRRWASAWKWSIFGGFPNIIYTNIRGSFIVSSNWSVFNSRHGVPSTPCIFKSYRPMLFVEF